MKKKKTWVNLDLRGEICRERCCRMQRFKYYVLLVNQLSFSGEHKKGFPKEYLHNLYLIRSIVIGNNQPKMFFVFRLSHSIWPEQRLFAEKNFTNFATAPSTPHCSRLAFGSKNTWYQMHPTFL